MVVAAKPTAGSLTEAMRKKDGLIWWYNPAALYGHSDRLYSKPLRARNNQTEGLSFRSDPARSAEETSSLPLSLHPDPLLWWAIETIASLIVTPSLPSSSHHYARTPSFSSPPSRISVAALVVDFSLVEPNIALPRTVSFTRSTLLPIPSPLATAIASLP
jgi:hypothetical protein